MEVAGEASDGREVIDLIKAHQPDVVLMDISMPGLNGLQALARITRDFPQVRVIILSMHHNDEYVLQALKSGASGYLLKRAATAELPVALKSVVGGEIYLSREISQPVPQEVPPATNRPLHQPARAVDLAPARDPPTAGRRPDHQGHRFDPESQRQDR